MSEVKVHTVNSEDLSPRIVGEGFCTDVVRYSDYASMEAKCAALAAELSAVDEIHNDALYISDDHYDQCPPEVQKIIGHLAVMQIPAYNAFIAEQRALGVDMFGQYHNFSEKLFIQKEAQKFAAKLRQEADQ